MNEEEQQMLEDILKRDSKLSDWERQFIDSIMYKQDSLTQKQSDKLEEIWERLT